MKFETFIEKFDVFSDAPDAVAKMRELILQLAAHGKLLEQSSDDEPASALVTRIEKHIEGLRIRKEFRGSPVEPLDRDVLPEIPSSWEWVRLGNVVDYGSSDKAESANIPEDAWLLDLEDIEKDTSRLLRRKSFRDSPSKSTKTAFVGGDVLYGKLRPYLNKVIVADAPGYCTTEIIPIRTFGFIDSSYLCHALKRPDFIAYANSKSYGMNLPRLGTEDARSAPFPLPPLAEQKRIVAKVDELMALCDRLEAQQRERETRHAALAQASLGRFAEAPTPANLDFLFHASYAIPPAELRKSILTLAVQGRLVPQDPNDEPAAELLTRIQGDLSKKEVGSRADKCQVAEDELPHEVPFSWCWSCVQELAQPNESVTYGILKPVWVEFGVPTVRVTEMKTGVIDVDALPKCDPERAAKFSKTTLNEGDLLVSKDGTIGKTAFVPPELAGGNITQHMLRFAISKRLNREFIRLCIDAPPCQEWMLGETKGVALQGVNVGDFRRMPLPLPSLAEQRRIVAKVDELMALVDALEALLTTARTTRERLLEAAVAELTQAA
jgi:type I restriction enzyme S subunit